MEKPFHVVKCRGFGRLFGMYMIFFKNLPFDHKRYTGWKVYHTVHLLNRAYEKGRFDTALA